MKKYKLYILDSDPATLNLLKIHFRSSNGFELIGAADNGETALREIRKFAPDIILTDMILRGSDIFLLLRELSRLDFSPMILLYSEFISSASLELALRNGAASFIYKPLDLSSLESVLLQYAELREEKRRFRVSHEQPSYETLSKRIFSIMSRLGFSTRYSGSTYIAESVLLAHESVSILRNLSTGLYPMLSERIRVSPSRIERSMRTAISAANASGHLSRRLGAAPTNKTCIRYLLQCLNSKNDELPSCILFDDMLR